MKRLLVVLAVMVLLLAACGGSSPAGSEEALSGAAADTEALFKDWTAAAQSLDLERMMSHYADEVTFNPEDGTSHTGRDYVKETYGYVMGLHGIKLGMKGYFISSDGRWAAGEGTLDWTPVEGGATISESGLIILEFGNGKIVREIHYLEPAVERSGDLLPDKGPLSSRLGSGW